jgi:hypothetical protein
VAKDSTADMTFDARIDASPLNGRQLVGFVELLTHEPATVSYAYNAITKTVEPVKERVTLAETLLELDWGTNKSKRFSSGAARE